MNSKNKTLIEIVGVIALAVAAILIFRFEDIRGGVFTESVELISTQGIILSSDTKFHVGVKGASGHHLNIKYEFSVNNKKYVSAKVSFGNKIFRDKEKALNIIKKYPTGKQVTVYYEKDNPNLSVLNPDRNSNKEFLITTLVLIVFSVLVAFLFMRANKKRKANPK